MKTNLACLLFSLLSFQPLLALPPDAEALKSKRDAKIAEINGVYATELAKLQKKAMAAGNLEVANEIEKEIAKATPDPFGSSKFPKLDGKWLVNGKSTRIFKGDLLTDETSGKHSCSYDGESITIQWGKSWEKLSVDSGNLDILKGVNADGTSMVYKRISRQ